MIRYNDHIIMPADFPETEAMLKAEGFHVLTVGNSECGKIDGGVSCLSLRFKAQNICPDIQPFIGRYVFHVILMT